jgi:hypothetical protein
MANQVTARDDDAPARAMTWRLSDTLLSVGALVFVVAMWSVSRVTGLLAIAGVCTISGVLRWWYERARNDS